jgi:hypothetical protein
VFSRLRQTFEEAGERLAYMATMTVFITDARPWGPLYATAEGDLRRQFPVIVVTYLRLRILSKNDNTFQSPTNSSFVVTSTLLPRYTEENQGD